MVVVPDASLYRDEATTKGMPDDLFARGAIGAVLTTDVLSCHFRGMPGLGAHGVLDVREQPSARAALASFAEFLRLAVAVPLDISPDEFRVGRQPLSVDGVRTEQVFLADALENGAGYARLAAMPGNLHAWLSSHHADQRAAWHEGGHAGSCDRSCPDCLRNYGNRFSHGLLDWRLALDLAEVAVGLPLDESRWLKGAGDPVVRSFAGALGQMTGAAVATEVHAGLACVVAGAKAMVLGHPLWHVAGGLAQPRQLAAIDALRAAHGDLAVSLVDARDLGIRQGTYLVSMLP